MSAMRKLERIGVNQYDSCVIRYQDAGVINISNYTAFGVNTIYCTRNITCSANEHREGSLWERNFAPVRRIQLVSRLSSGIFSIVNPQNSPLFLYFIRQRLLGRPPRPQHAEEQNFGDVTKAVENQINRICYE